MLDKLLNRDLVARSAALHAEHNELVAQADLTRRIRHLETQVDVVRARCERRIADLQTADENSVSQLAALNQQDQNDLMAETEAVNADAGLLERNQQRINDELDDIKATETRRTVRLAQFGVAVELAAVVLGLILPPFSAKTAHAIRLDYYSAVAGITPVLLVAGFVELAFLRLGGGVWGVLTFGIPAIGAGSAALYVLADHRSTPSTLYLTIWGLASTMALLIAYVVAHASFGRSR